MEVKKYIESGILEEYCLGRLIEEEQSFLVQMSLMYPDVKAELEAVELTMEKLAELAAVEPAHDLKHRILASLGFDNVADRFDINNLPAVDDNADLETWLNTLNHLIPEDPAEDFIYHVIRNDKHYQQMLVVTKNDIPEEEHGDFLESFFILKGQCKCTVGNNFHHLGAGDFLEIPLHVPHDINIESPYVVGILQYQFV